MKPLPASIDRRTFLKFSATAAGGMLLSLECVTFGSSESEAPARLTPFVRVDPDGRITLYAPKPDIGQGVQTSLPMIVAEELDAAWEQVTVEPLPIGLERKENGRIGWTVFSQDVGGSTSVSESFDGLRSAGAEARRRLVYAAAERWGVTAEACTTTAGQVHHPESGRSLGYGALAADAVLVTVPDSAPPLKARSDYRIIGQPKSPVHLEQIVTGQMEFGIDAEFPGMLHAVVMRAPRLGAELLSFDGEPALALPGVRHVVAIKGPGPTGDFTFKPIADGVAVVADSVWRAMKGRDALIVEWSDGPMKGETSATLAERASDLMGGDGQVLRDDGDAESALAGAERIFDAAYDVPLVAHATLEPQSCTAWVEADRVRLIVPTQDCSDTVMLAAERTGLDLAQIEARFTRSGGGFGRRLDEDYVAEAVDISKAVGAPVRVHWTREDDMRNDFYRPLAHHRLRAGFDADGELVAWTHDIATTGRYFRRGVAREEIFLPEYWLDDFPAHIAPNLKVAYYFLETAIPTGPWRAPGHTANAFAVQSFLDEIAHGLERDPLDLRLSLLGEPRELAYEQHGGPVFDTGRLANVLQMAASTAGWGTSVPEGHGRGIAGHFTFGSYVAHVVDVAVTPGGDLRVLKVTSAIDCGLAVNPDGIRAQTEGCINDGLSCALHQRISLADGAIEQSNFHDYRMMRIDEAPPDIEVVIVDSPHPPSGMGEPPIPPVAPALGNAIFQATGKRIRALPIGSRLKTAGRPATDQPQERSTRL